MSETSRDVPQEREIKLLLSDLEGLAERLETAGASLIQPRVYELDLRFDDAQGSLSADHRVLRLRRDHTTHLTYKGPAQLGQPVSVRDEIEVEVSDFEKTRMFLEALGYHVSVFYEKYRRTYLFRGAQVMLDEMPYGTFCEIEGPSPDQIIAIAQQLGLDPDCKVLESYLTLFERLRAEKGWTLANLSFDGFAGMSLTPADLGLRPADHP
jgi:adenylate cyclase class 2